MWRRRPEAAVMGAFKKDDFYVASLVPPRFVPRHPHRAFDSAGTLSRVDHGRAISGADLAALVRATNRNRSADLEAIRCGHAQLQYHGIRDGVHRAGATAVSAAKPR